MSKPDRYKELIERLQVITYEYNIKDKRFTYVSSQAKKMLGYSIKQWMEPNFWFDHLHKTDRLWAPAYSREQCRMLKDHEFEYRMIAADGSTVWFKDCTSVITKNGIPFKLQGMLVNSTQYKHSETKLEETERRLSSILNNLSNIVFYENEDNLVFISDNVYDMLGYSAEEFYKENKLFSSLVHPEDYKRIFKRIENWFNSGEEGTIKTEFRLKKKSGSYIWIEDTMFTVTSGHKKSWYGFFIDISDRKHAEDRLNETTARLTAIERNLTNLTVYETGGDKNYISDNIFNLTGLPAEDFLADRNLFNRMIHPEDSPNLFKKINKWLNNGAIGVLSSEFRITNHNGENVWIEDHMFNLNNNAGKKLLSGIMIDITDKKLAQEKIQDTEIRLSSVLSNLPRIVIYQSGNNKDFISENIFEMIGYAPEEIINRNLFLDKIIHAEDLPKKNKLVKKWKLSGSKKDVLIMEYRLCKKDGSYMWIEDHMFEVKPPNQYPYISGILIDITERKIIEQKITQSLKEKEMLLKEIHHRVKNNLQVISSLLKLQSKYTNDISAGNVLLESRNRVRSMALVHQNLYQSEDFSNVDFSDYAQKLINDLINIYKTGSRNIKLNIKSDNIFIGVDIAVPCGLIINELVTNSLKYAFNGYKNGTIDVKLSKYKNGNYKIMVKDNGIGFPEEIDYKNTKTLGMQLVNTLVKQLDGSIELEKTKGTAFTIIFNSASKNNFELIKN